MNDTIRLRQNQILSLLADKSLSREKITAKLPGFYRITVIRDLNSLEKAGLVRKEGKGPAVKYISLQNPLLRAFDTESYFSADPAIRLSAQTGFNSKIFDYFLKLPEEELNLKRLSDQERKLDPTIFKREIERFTIEFSWKSSRIEGNTYSLLETEILIKQAKEAFGHSQYEATMILNHKRAMDFILQNRSYFKELSVVKIIKLHGLLTGDLEITSGLRRDPVAITGTNYIPPSNRDVLKKFLEKTVEIINLITSPVLKAMTAGCMIPYLQPFVDGNKRIGRTLTNAILIANDLYPLSYRDTLETDYVKAMILFYEQNSLHLFRKIFLSQINFSLQNYFRTN